MMVYEIRSRGEGADDGLDLLSTWANSSAVTGDMSMVEPDSGGGGDGIQGGVWN